jgi:hypothetical protein
MSKRQVATVAMIFLLTFSAFAAGLEFVFLSESNSAAKAAHGFMNNWLPLFIVLLTLGYEFLGWRFLDKIVNPELALTVLTCALFVALVFAGHSGFVAGDISTGDYQYQYASIATWIALVLLVFGVYHVCGYRPFFSLAMPLMALGFSSVLYELPLYIVKAQEWYFLFTARIMVEPFLYVYLAQRYSRPNAVLVIIGLAVYAVLTILFYQLPWQLPRLSMFPLLLAMAYSVPKTKLNTA